VKTARSVPVLMYHHVSPSPGLVTLTPANFADQMRGLAAAGYRTLSAERFAAFLAGEHMPDKSVLITFDDGYLDNWVYAYPVLREHGFSAAVFLVTGWIKDGPRRPHAGEPGTALPATPDHNECKRLVVGGRSDDVILRWSEIEAAAKDGVFECHSHTHSHTRWDKLHRDRQAKCEALADDLRASRAVLAERLGDCSDHLCWPQGYFDHDYLAVARANGFRHFHTIAPGANRPGDDPGRIHRIVTKDRPASWLLSRLWIYRHPLLARWYAGERAN
jgi:peptidoglycan/xylan/chitin deacetylase (PgdA/CDA1 family)